MPNPRCHHLPPSLAGTFLLSKSPSYFHVFLCVDSVSSISLLLPERGWEAIYWNKGNLPVVIPQNKITPLPQEQVTANSL